MTRNWTAEARYDEPPFLLWLQVTGENPHSQPASYHHSRLLLLVLQWCGYVFLACPHFTTKIQLFSLAFENRLGVFRRMFFMI